MVVGSGNLPGVNSRITNPEHNGFALFSNVDGGDERIITFKFPSLRLTTVNSKGVQNANYKVTDFFGLNQQLSSSNTLDQSYRDLFRAMPRGFDAHANSGVSAQMLQNHHLSSHLMMLFMTQQTLEHIMSLVLVQVELLILLSMRSSPSRCKNQAIYSSTLWWF